MAPGEADYGPGAFMLPVRRGGVVSVPSAPAARLRLPTLSPSKIGNAASQYGEHS